MLNLTENGMFIADWIILCLALFVASLLYRQLCQKHPSASGRYLVLCPKESESPSRHFSYGLGFCPPCRFRRSPTERLQPGRGLDRIRSLVDPPLWHRPERKCPSRPSDLLGQRPECLLRLLHHPLHRSLRPK